MMRFPLALALLAALCGASCGYHVKSAAGRLPGGASSLGIPTFRNLTDEFKVEQVVTRALLREFGARTRGRVDSRGADSPDGGPDLVLLGEVKEVRAVPVIFGSSPAGAQTFGSAFQVTVRLGAKLVRRSDSAVVWEDADFLFRERYLLNADVRDFFAEDGPALERLAREVASSLAGAVLER
ncbi:MAG: LPS assembly lipoprotein LptE [Acidobacteriota bacterium]|nr:LPS assembly lipoprotein LptE [Acidobacteriota bacterium]